jgi:protein farnesyltransferase subunit beta
MHENGEDDLRSVYIVMVTATVLNIVTSELIDGVADYIASCQTYEGGFGANPFAEAHGGYLIFYDNWI